MGDLVLEFNSLENILGIKMSEYKLLYIDESQEDIDDFLDYLESKDTNSNFSITSLFPAQTLEEMVEIIFEEKADAIVVDFKLNDLKSSIKYNVPYNGVELTERILEIKKDFPCFVITSFDNDAIRVSRDVNLVYIKGILHGNEDKTEARASFIDKIENQILHYRQRIDVAKTELYQLEEKSKHQSLDSSEEARILELDTILEAITNQKNMIPKQLKSYENLEKLHKLIDNTDQLLKSFGIHQESDDV